MNFELFHLVSLLGVATTESEEVAVGAVLFVGALGKSAVFGIFVVGGENLFDFLVDKCVECFCILRFEVFHRFFLGTLGRSELDDARIVLLIFFRAVHEGGDEVAVDS